MVQQPEDPASDSFPVWLNHLLLERGLTQRQVAQELGVTPKTVSRWLRRQSQPKYPQLVRIAATFGTPPQLRGAEPGEVGG